MENKIDKDFLDINNENKYKDYIIVIIMYIIVIILFILLMFGFKNQKNIVKENFNNDIKNQIEK